ncbi:MAG: M36 family metallopeptidase [Nocardioidaceae bacterium]
MGEPPTVIAGNITPGAFGQRPFELDRDYSQPFKDVWNNSRCDPTTLTPGADTTPVAGGNDILPAVTHLFATHNRMHDFSYPLGFTEGNYNLQDSNFGNRGQGLDPEIGNVQSGAITGSRAFLAGGRDNANQLTLQDGIPGITNQYLFQPLAGAFYAPCVDGDFDFGVVGHEYTHAISNRMVGGPDSGLSGFQAGSMGESWSDQVAAEYLLAHNYKGGVSPFVEGAYVTGNKQTGIRNYRLDRNPLQYGDLGYDITGPEVHADGEPWSAVQIDIRQAMVQKYNSRFPASNAALQRLCAQGNTFAEPPLAPPPAQQCPGNRRWIQMLFDAFLLQQPATSMLDARDAMLAADRMRFGGANQTLLWREYANNGFGLNASTKSTEDDQPKSGYTSPFANEGTLRLGASDLTSAVKGKLYVGDYEARVTPIADTDSSTARPSSVRMVPGTYHFVFQADGYGLKRFSLTIQAGKTTSRVVHLAKNVASSKNGAVIDGFGPLTSMNTTKLIDDTEASNWAGVNPAGVSVDAKASHPFVNVDLAGDRARVIRAVKVSALLRPADPKQDESEPQPDMSSGSRFTALRKFAIEICTESAPNECSSTLPSGTAASPYKRIYTSPDDAFNGVKPRPLAPALLMKQFDIPDRSATHVRLVALENQCTGQRGFAGEQDNDLSNNTDCKSGSTRDESVRAAELEVFGYDAQTRPPGDPVVLMTMTGKPVASAGEQVTYKLSYTNYGPKPSSNADIRIAQLPSSLRFLSASGDSQWSSTARSLRYKLGTVPVGVTRSVTLTTRVAPGAPVGSAIITTAQFAGAMTYSPPAAAVTLVGP